MEQQHEQVALALALALVLALALALDLALALALTLILTLTRYAATTVCLTKLVGETCPPGSNFEFSCCCPGKVGEQEKKERRATAFFRNKLAPLM